MGLIAVISRHALGFWVCGLLGLRVKVDQYHRRSGQKSCAGQRMVSAADSHFILKTMLKTGSGIKLMPDPVLNQAAAGMILFFRSKTKRAIA